MLAIILHTYAIICGIGILNKVKWKCCRLSFPLRNIYVLHLSIAGATLGCLCIWIFSSNATKYEFNMAEALWVYLGLVVCQFLLKIHF